MSERVPAEAFELREATGIAPGEYIDADGNVKIHIIRPGLGRGKGNHLYEANMLERDAGVFEGWKMYIDHLSPEAKKAAQGLPRSWNDYGGRVLESHWDPSVPADEEKGWGQGAVVGTVKPFGQIALVAEKDPEVLEASIAATATGVKPIMRDGKRVFLVEGIEPRGSVDWVTEAGAGGRVVPLLESAYTEGVETAMEELNALSDEQVTEYLRDHRAELLEQLTPDPTTVEVPVETNVAEVLQQPEVQEFLRGMVEAALDEERSTIRAEARADADRTIKLRDLRDTAHQIINEAKLPESWKQELRSRFEITEAGPSAKLDVMPEVDGDGNVTKPVEDILRESVHEEVSHQRELLAAAAPTRVTHQGGKVETEGEEKGERKLTGYAAQFLQEAGVNAEEAYGLKTLED